MERLLKSRYKIKEKIGEGPFSITYKGSLLDKDDPLVIKIYKRSVLSSSLIKAVKRKVRDLCNIIHPNIARVIDGDYGWQGFYFVRDYVEGRSLSDIIKVEPKMDVEIAVGMILGVCEGLSFAHKRGIVHGALSPNNVFVSEKEITKTTDFIIVGEMRGSIREKAEVALSGQSSYLSPEEIGGEAPGYSSDIYSVGLLLYVMLTGKHPFREEGGGRSSLNILRATPERPRALRGDMPDYLENIIIKAMEKDPLLRFRTIGELISSIKNKAVVEEAEKTVVLPEMSLEGLIETAEAEGEADAAGKKEARPNLLLVIAVIVLAALFGIGYALVSGLLFK